MGVDVGVGLGVELAVAVGDAVAVAVGDAVWVAVSAGVGASPAGASLNSDAQATNAPSVNKATGRTSQTGTLAATLRTGIDSVGYQNNSKTYRCAMIRW